MRLHAAVTLHALKLFFHRPQPRSTCEAQEWNVADRPQEGEYQRQEVKRQVIDARWRRLGCTPRATGAARYGQILRALHASEKKERQLDRVTAPADENMVFFSASSDAMLPQPCTPRKPTSHFDMSSSFCNKLTHDSVEQWVRNARGEKAAFFEHMRAGTQPHNITGAVHRSDYRNACRRHSPRTSSTPPLRVMFIGDSIVEELMHVYRKLIAQGSVQITFYNVFNLTDYDGSVNWSGYVSGKESTLVMPWHRLATEDWDAVFFGMGQMWRLLRQSREAARPSREPTSRGGQAARGLDWRTRESMLPYRDAGNRQLYSPYRFHRAAVRLWIARLVCLSRARALPIVFVGSQVVDEQVLLLNPPKVDWDDFHGFGLAHVMALVEHDAERELCREMPPHAPHDVTFFHPSVFARACPGARCDGMHYNSHYPHPRVDHPLKDLRGWSCHRSLDLWCPFVEDYLRRYLPQLLFGEPRRCGERDLSRARSSSSSSAPSGPQSDSHSHSAEDSDADALVRRCFESDSA